MGFKNLREDEMIYKDEMLNLALEYDVEFSAVLDFSRRLNYDMEAVESDIHLLSKLRKSQRKKFREENPHLC